MGMDEMDVDLDRWYTQEEFARFCERFEDDLHHYELLNGRIVMNPPAGWPHGSAVRISSILDTFVEERGLGRVLANEQGFELPSGDTVAPDVAYVSNERWDAAPTPRPGKFLRVVPDLAVEVLSSSTAARDRGEKKGIYERNGVLEYWIADLTAVRVARFFLQDGGYGMPVIFGIDDVFESRLLEGLRFPVSRIAPRP